MGLNPLRSMAHSRPLLRVQLHKLQNRLSGMQTSPRLWFVALATLYGIYWLSPYIRGSHFDFAAELSTLEGKVLLGILIAGAFALITAARYRRVSETLVHSWLASTAAVNPLSFMQRFTTSLWPLLLIGVGVVIIAWLVTPYAANDSSLSWMLVTCLAVCVGLPAGLFFGTRPKPRKRRSSRYVRDPKAAPSVVTQITAHASWLSQLPVREALALAQPANSRLLFFTALITLPAGITGVMVIAILAAWVLLAWLVTLAVAVPIAAAAAHRWLESTTLPFRTFQWLIIRRALLHYGLAAMVVGPTCVLLDASLLEIIRLVAFNLVLFLAWSTFTVFSVWHGRDDRWMGGIGAALTAALENRFAGFGTLTALLITALCLHRGGRDART